MYSQADLAMDLEMTWAKGFDVIRLSKVAFDIYQSRALELTAPMDRVRLTLMAMQESAEFELTELEFLALILKIKAM